MRHGIWIVLAVALVAIPLVVMTQEAEPGSGPGAPGGRPRGGNPGERFMNQYDANGDGKVSEGEWVDAFRKLDTDNDGVVTKEELDAYAQKQREEYWKNLDEDEDGAISADEWPGRKEAFDRIDADNDGSVSTEEIEKMQERMRQWRQDREGEGGGRGGRGRGGRGGQGGAGGGQ